MFSYTNTYRTYISADKRAFVNTFLNGLEAELQQSGIHDAKREDNSVNFTAPPFRYVWNGFNRFNSVSGGNIYFVQNNGTLDVRYRLHFTEMFIVAACFSLSLLTATYKWYLFVGMFIAIWGLFFALPSIIAIYRINRYLRKHVEDSLKRAYMQAAFVTTTTTNKTSPQPKNNFINNKPSINQEAKRRAEEEQATRNQVEDLAIETMTTGGLIQDLFTGKISTGEIVESVAKRVFTEEQPETKVEETIRHGKNAKDLVEKLLEEEKTEPIRETPFVEEKQELTTTTVIEEEKTETVTETSVIEEKQELTTIITPVVEEEKAEIITETSVVEEKQEFTTVINPVIKEEKTEIVTETSDIEIEHQTATSKPNYLWIATDFYELIRLRNYEAAVSNMHNRLLRQQTKQAWIEQLKTNETLGKYCKHTVLFSEPATHKGITEILFVLEVQYQKGINSEILSATLTDNTYQISGYQFELKETITADIQAEEEEATSEQPVVDISVFLSQFYSNLQQNNYEAAVDMFDASMLAQQDRATWLTNLQANQQAGSYKSHTFVDTHIKDNDEIQFTFDVAYEKATNTEVVTILFADRAYKISGYEYNLQQQEPVQQPVTKTEEKATDTSAQPDYSWVVTDFYAHIQQRNFDAVTDSFTKGLLSQKSYQEWVQHIEQLENFGKYKKHNIRFSEITSEQGVTKIIYMVEVRYAKAVTSEILSVVLGGNAYQVSGYEFELKESITDTEPEVVEEIIEETPVEDVSVFLSRFYRNIQERNYDAAVDMFDASMFAQLDRATWLTNLQASQQAGSYKSHTFVDTHIKDNDEIQFTFDVAYEQTTNTEVVTILFANRAYKISGYEYNLQQSSQQQEPVEQPVTTTEEKATETSAQPDYSWVVTDFYAHIQQRNFDAVTDSFTKGLLSQKSYQEWIQYIQQLENFGKYKKYKVLFSEIASQQGVIEIIYMVEARYTKAVTSEILSVVLGGNAYQVSGYEFELKESIADTEPEVIEEIIEETPVEDVSVFLSRFYRNIQERDYEATVDMFDASMFAQQDRATWLTNLQKNQQAGSYKSYTFVATHIKDNDEIQFTFDVAYEQTTNTEVVTILFANRAYKISGYEYNLQQQTQQQEPVEQPVVTTEEKATDTSAQPDYSWVVTDFYAHIQQRNFDAVTDSFTKGLLSQKSYQEWKEHVQQLENFGKYKKHNILFSETTSQQGVTKITYMVEVRYTKAVTSEILSVVLGGNAYQVSGYEFELKESIADTEPEVVEEIVEETPVEDVSEFLSRFYRSLQQRDYMAVIKLFDASMFTQRNQLEWLVYLQANQQGGSYKSHTFVDTHIKDNDEIQFTFDVDYEQVINTEVVTILFANRAYKISGYECSLQQQGQTTEQPTNFIIEEPIADEQEPIIELEKAEEKQPDIEKENIPSIITSDVTTTEESSSAIDETPSIKHTPETVGWIVTDFYAHVKGRNYEAIVEKLNTKLLLVQSRDKWIQMLQSVEIIGKYSKHTVVDTVITDNEVRFLSDVYYQQGATTETLTVTVKGNSYQISDYEFEQKDDFTPTANIEEETEVQLPPVQDISLFINDFYNNIAQRNYTPIVATLHDSLLRLQSREAWAKTLQSLEVLGAYKFHSIVSTNIKDNDEIVFTFDVVYEKGVTRDEMTIMFVNRSYKISGYEFEQKDLNMATTHDLSWIATDFYSHIKLRNYEALVEKLNNKLLISQSRESWIQLFQSVEMLGKYTKHAILYAQSRADEAMFVLDVYYQQGSTTETLTVNIQGNSYQISNYEFEQKDDFTPTANIEDETDVQLPPVQDISLFINDFYNNIAQRNYTAIVDTLHDSLLRLQSREAWGNTLKSLETLGVYKFHSIVSTNIKDNDEIVFAFDVVYEKGVTRDEMTIMFVNRSYKISGYEFEQKDLNMATTHDLSWVATDFYSHIKLRNYEALVEKLNSKLLASQSRQAWVQLFQSVEMLGKYTKHAILYAQSRADEAMFVVDVYYQQGSTTETLTVNIQGNSYQISNYEFEQKDDFTPTANIEEETDVQLPPVQDISLFINDFYTNIAQRNYTPIVDTLHDSLLRLQSREAWGNTLKSLETLGVYKFHSIVSTNIKDNDEIVFAFDVVYEKGVTRDEMTIMFVNRSYKISGYEFEQKDLNMATTHDLSWIATDFYSHIKLRNYEALVEKLNSKLLASQSRQAWVQLFQSVEMLGKYTKHAILYAQSRADEAMFVVDVYYQQGSTTETLTVNIQGNSYQISNYEFEQKDDFTPTANIEEETDVQLPPVQDISLFINDFYTNIAQRNYMPIVDTLHDSLLRLQSREAWGNTLKSLETLGVYKFHSIVSTNIKDNDEIVFAFDVIYEKGVTRDEMTIMFVNRSYKISGYEFEQKDLNMATTHDLSWVVTDFYSHIKLRNYEALVEKLTNKLLISQSREAWIQLFQSLEMLGKYTKHAILYAQSRADEAMFVVDVYYQQGGTTETLTVAIQGNSYQISEYEFEQKDDFAPMTGIEDETDVQLPPVQDISLFINDFYNNIRQRKYTAIVDTFHDSLFRLQSREAWANMIQSLEVLGAYQQHTITDTRLKDGDEVEFVFDVAYEKGATTDMLTIMLVNRTYKISGYEFEEKTS